MSSGDTLVLRESFSPVELFNNRQNLDLLLDTIRDKAKGEPVDISTAAGRQAVKSLAFKVARSKTLLDDAGKELVEEHKRYVKTIDAERKHIRDTLDALKDEVRKPLTEWEEAEDRRIYNHKAAMQAIQELGKTTGSMELLADARIKAENAFSSRDWQEFAKDAAVVHAQAIEKLDQAVEAENKRIEEAAKRAEEKARLAEERAKLAEERKRLEEEKAELERANRRVVLERVDLAVQRAAENTPDIPLAETPSLLVCLEDIVEWVRSNSDDSLFCARLMQSEPWKQALFSLGRNSEDAERYLETA